MKKNAENRKEITTPVRIDYCNETNAGEPAERNREMNNSRNAGAAANRIPMTQELFASRIEAAHAGNFRGNTDNFQNIEIADVTLENRTLTGAEFNFAKLTDVRLSGVNLGGAEFHFAELRNVTFTDCNLGRVGFDFAAMENVTFNRCLLNSSTFDYASGNAVFTDCTVEGAEFHHSGLAVTMTRCSGGHIEICYCPELTLNAEDCDFHRGGFMDSTLRGSMKKCVFTDADFAGSDGRELAFAECGLRDVNTCGALGISKADDEDDDDDLDFELE